MRRQGANTIAQRAARAGAVAALILTGCVDEFPTVTASSVVPVDATADAQAVDGGIDANPRSDSGSDMGGPTDLGVIDGGPCMPADEICNGVDDDCDGVADEQQPRVPCPLTLGVCAGNTVGCIEGAYAECDPGLANGDYEREETRCDQLDNDCDGDVDEGCGCVPGESQACGSDEGACLPGLQVCGPDGFGACEGAVGGSAEVCNGADDDCDMATDEDTPSTPCDTGLAGICSGGEQPCGGQCAQRLQPRAETCDTLDNDCDGATDEEIAPQRCALDPARPECGQGETRCVDGGLTCVASAGRLDATCDAVDDDCDGRVDEDAAGQPCVEGLCAGTRTCQSGVPGCMLTPLGVEDPGPDDIDDDCDGETDEGPLTVYLEDVLVGGDGRRPGLPRAYVPGYAERSVRGSGGFNAGASQVLAVDWVFRPNAADGALPISSTALSHDFAANVGFPESWTPPAKGPLAYNERPVPLDTTPHILELHANIGVTFDLDVVRAAHPDRALIRFRGRAGSSDRGQVQIKVLLDARTHFLSDCTARRNNNTAALQTIPAAALDGVRFLTFAALDCGNDNIDNRHGFLLDARIAFSARE